MDGHLDDWSLKPTPAGVCSELTYRFRSTLRHFALQTMIEMPIRPSESVVQIPPSIGAGRRQFERSPTPIPPVRGREHSCHGELAPSLREKH